MSWVFGGFDPGQYPGYQEPLYPLAFPQFISYDDADYQNMNNMQDLQPAAVFGSQPQVDSTAYNNNAGAVLHNNGGLQPMVFPHLVYPLSDVPASLGEQYPDRTQQTTATSQARVVPAKVNGANLQNTTSSSSPLTLKPSNATATTGGPNSRPLETTLARAAELRAKLIEDMKKKAGNAQPQQHGLLEKGTTAKLNENNIKQTPLQSQKNTTPAITQGTSAADIDNLLAEARAAEDLKKSSPQVQIFDKNRSTPTEKSNMSTKKQDQVLKTNTQKLNNQSLSITSTSKNKTHDLAANGTKSINEPVSPERPQSVIISQNTKKMQADKSLNSTRNAGAFKSDQALRPVNEQKAARLLESPDYGQIQTKSASAKLGGLMVSQDKKTKATIPVTSATETESIDHISGNPRTGSDSSVTVRQIKKPEILQLVEAEERNRFNSLKSTRLDTHDDRGDSDERVYYLEAPQHLLAFGDSAFGDDLEAWLDMTGYYDRTYREKALQRHRDIISLDYHKSQLMREAREDNEERAHISRSRTIAPQEVEFLPWADNLRNRSVSTAGPSLEPWNILVNDRESRNDRDSDTMREWQESPRSIKAGTIGIRGMQTYHDKDIIPTAQAGIKRRFSGTTNEDHPITKVSRVRKDRHFQSGMDNSLPLRTLGKEVVREDIRASPKMVPLGTRAHLQSPGLQTNTTTNRSAAKKRLQVDKAQVKREGQISRQDKDDHPPTRGTQNARPLDGDDDDPWDASNLVPVKRSQQELRRGVVLSHGYRHRSRSPLRESRPPNSISHPNADNRGPRNDRTFRNQRPLDLTKGTCFFMIKSYNHANVWLSQDEGVWMTQVINEEKFADAFMTFNNVIFVFSVNESHCFQGFARMESLPGEARDPSWAKSLHWKCSPAFRVRWLSTTETSFDLVHHLTNTYNENRRVFVGRDGQEIEARVGAELCEILGDNLVQRSGRARPISRDDLAW